VVLRLAPRERHHGAVVQDHEHRADDGEERADNLGLAVQAAQPHLLHAQDQGHDEGDAREGVDHRRHEPRRGHLRAHVVQVLVKNRSAFIMYTATREIVTIYLASSVV
jgi:hypothetical protein